jgi:hypothetical protein
MAVFIAASYNRAMLIRLAALAASLAFAAEPALKPVKVITAPIAYNFLSSGGRYLLTAGQGSVGVWDLAGPRQIALVPIPGWESRSGDSNGVMDQIHAWGVSADGKWALASLEETPYANFNDENSWQEQQKLFLISIPEQRVVRTLADTDRRPCVSYGGITPICVQISEVAFSPDGTKVKFGMSADPRLLKNDPSATARERVTDSFVDLSGKTLDRRAHDVPWAPTAGGGMWLPTPERPVSGFLADGSPALLYVDGAGCSVKTLAGKQISFLEDCTAESKPAFGEGRIVSKAGQLVLWDPITGAAATRVAPPASHQTAFSADFSRFAEVSFDTMSAPAAALLRVADAAGRRTIFERRLELPPGAQAPNTDDSWLRYSAQDGRVALMVGAQVSANDYKNLVAVYDLGAAAPAAEAAASPAIDVDEPPASKTKLNPDAYAVVIGVEKYRQDGIPAVDFAARDARTMYAYLTRAMGFDPKNVMLLTDEKATKTDFEKNLGKWLRNRADAKSRVFVYYAGHGAPNAASGEGFLMPYEADPNYVEDTAYPITRLYAELAKLPTRDVTVVLDACFSGRGGRSLMAKGARPLVSIKEALGPANAVVLAAATGGQISGTDPDRRHGLLTESLLEALHGAADARGDGKITSEEIFAYVRTAVERAARLQNIEQTPTLSPAPGETKGGRAWIELK